MNSRNSVVIWARVYTKCSKCRECNYLSRCYTPSSCLRHCHHQIQFWRVCTIRLHFHLILLCNITNLRPSNERSCEYLISARWRLFSCMICHVSQNGIKRIHILFTPITIRHKNRWGHEMNTCDPHFVVWLRCYLCIDWGQVFRSDIPFR